MKICKLENGCSECNNKCENCRFKDTCDFYWINKLWMAENKLNGKDSLLGPAMPINIKTDLRENHIISISGDHDFCCFNNPKTKDYVVIGDIYVDDSLRGQGISRKLLNYLMETYDKDIFAKCVRGTSAETFWSHIGTQIDANADSVLEHDMYEHRPGKRDLGHYLVKNNNKKADKEDLW